MNRSHVRWVPRVILGKVMPDVYLGPAALTAGVCGADDLSELRGRGAQDPERSGR